MATDRFKTVRTHGGYTRYIVIYIYLSFAHVADRFLLLPTAHGSISGKRYLYVCVFFFTHSRFSLCARPLRDEQARLRPELYDYYY